MIKNIIASVIAGIVASLATALIVVSLIGGNTQPVSKPSENVGAATPGTRFPHGITIGLPANSPNNIADIKAGTCTLLGTDVSHAASTTKPYDCAITGMVSGDIVSGIIATTTQFVGQNYWAIVGAKASTTAGFATFEVYSNTPTGALSAYGVGSTTNYQVTKTQ